MTPARSLARAALILMLLALLPCCAVAGAADWITADYLPNIAMAERGYGLGGLVTDQWGTRAVHLFIVPAPGYTAQSGAGFWGRGVTVECMDYHYSGPGGSIYYAAGLCPTGTGARSERMASNRGQPFMPGVARPPQVIAYDNVDTLTLWNEDGTLQSATLLPPGRIVVRIDEDSVTIPEELLLRLESLAPDGSGERMYFGTLASDFGPQPGLRRWEVLGAGGTALATYTFTRWGR